MLIFVFCLFCAGAILSFFVRFPLLALVTLLAAIATPTGVVLGVIGKELVGSTLGAFFLPLVTLQVGYGFGVIASAWFDGPVRSRRPIDPRREKAEPSSSADHRPQMDSSRSF